MPLKHAAKLSLALLLGALSWSAHAVDEKDLLPVDQAFALQAEATSRDAIALTWKIAPGYYLYRHRTSVTATGFDGTLEMPPGKHKRDEFFGDVETYRTQLQATFAGRATAGAQTATLKVKYQGCADAGVCYPPQTRTLQVALPSPVAGLLGGAPVQQGPSLLGGDANGEPLPPEQAFNIDAIADSGDALLVRMTPAPGYYIYRDKTQMRIDAGDGIALRAPQWPAGKQHRDEHFGEVVVYFDPVDVKVPLQRAHARAVEGTLHIDFQGCQDGGICYPVMSRVLPVSLPAGTVSRADDADANGAVDATADAPLAEDQRLARSLEGTQRGWSLVLFFVYGLGLAFTPCVLPMVPILSGLIAGGGTRVGAARGFSLSLVYVLASAVVFTIAGVLAGMLGAAANLQAWMQNAWVLGAFAALFVVLALSMFGLYELQLPAALRSRLGAASDRQRGGSWWGVAAMGALSALIVGPCVAPPLMGAVLYIAQTRDPVFGGAALFLLALGMGAPLIAFGMAAGRGMPTSGPWMMAVQRVFGFVFLGLAIWMLSRVLPASLTLALWGLLALGAATWLFTLGAKPGTKLAARFAAVVLGVVGAAELLGAMAGGHDPLQPLSVVVGEKREALAFKRIKSVEDLDRELAAARANGQPVMLDFYADWCVSCKEMEKYVFTQPKVHEALRDYVLLQADVTANDARDQALMQRFGIIGPPMSLFFHDGQERRGLRLTGFEEADKFVERAQRGAAN